MSARLSAYLAGAAGIALITSLIGIVRRWVDLPGLSVAYIVLVIYIGAWAGRAPALATALCSYVVYEFFFVPPYGSLLISAPRDVVNLVVLLAAAALSENLVGALVKRTVGAEARARESQSLYEVALAALRQSDPIAALQLLCERAAREPSVISMSIVEDREGQAPVTVAGPTASPQERTQAAWAIAHETSLGLRVSAAGLAIFEQIPTEPAYARIPGGAAIIRTAASPSTESTRVLAALVGMAGLLLDRRRGAETAERARQLAASDSVKAHVLSALAHEVKTPIASLRAGISAMDLDRHLTADQHAMLQGLSSQADRLDRIVQDVLTMTRLDEGLLGEREAVSAAEVVGSAVSSLQAQLAPFALSVEVPADLPQVLGDEVQLDRVFANLLENATHWTPPGGRITVGARSRAGEVEIWVGNEGPDITARPIASVLEAHWTQRAEGSGLGLAICRRIVEAHGGSIGVRNTRSGPRFTVTLPAVATAAVAP